MCRARRQRAAVDWPRDCDIGLLALALMLPFAAVDAALLRLLVSTTATLRPLRGRGVSVGRRQVLAGEFSASCVEAHVRSLSPLKMLFAGAIEIP